MPELPEAETIVRGLRTTIVGESIRRVEVLHLDILRQTKSIFSKRVRLRRINGIERRGKNVLLVLNGSWVIKVNLGMTGRLLPFSRPPRGTERPSHPAVRIRFLSGALLVFDDTRRFGSVEALSSTEWNEWSNLMGPEPLGPTYQVSRLISGLKSSSSPIRSWLLDQKRIAGVGNIYASEALFLAGVHPQRAAGRVSLKSWERITSVVKEVLTEAIRQGGTTLNDFQGPDGTAGYFQVLLRVYGRGGE